MRRVGTDERLERDLRDLRREVNERLARIESRLDRLHDTQLRLGAGALITFVVGFAGLIVNRL